MSRPHCTVCCTELEPGAPTFAIETVLDPFPPNGVACSEACASAAREESRRRALLLHLAGANPFWKKPEE